MARSAGPLSYKPGDSYTLKPKVLSLLLCRNPAALILLSRRENIWAIGASKLRRLYAEAPLLFERAGAQGDALDL
jgi:hypothetical protein